ncbi:MAG: hypothetical protein EPO21_07745 [Chloroflexota bacterium]|nr:MAG: hypothetical protein EPO21_07745 [Chloroflexota bacterium]
MSTICRPGEHSMDVTAQLVYFYPIAIIATVIFVVGLLWHLHVWVSGRVGHAPPRSRVANLGPALGAGLRAALRPSSLGGLLQDALLQRAILRRGGLRWAVHLCIMWSFVWLFVVGSLGNMLAERGLVDLQKDTPWFAISNEVAGLLLLIGLGIAAYRRYVSRPVQLALLTTWEDGLILGWLALLSVSGFVLEAVRFLDAGVPADVATYSLVGFGLSTLLRPLGADWTALYVPVWWIHGLGALVLVAYLPFSKLLHMVGTPLSLLGRIDQPHPAAYAEQPSVPGTDRFGAKLLLQMDACTRCGECVSWCESYAHQSSRFVAPAEKIKGYKPILKRGVVPSVLSGLFGSTDKQRLRELSQGIYECTLCARCAQACPAGISLRELWFSMREDMVARGIYPAGMNLAKDAVATQHNVVNYPNEERAMWVDYMAEAPDDAYQRPRAEVVYFVGCMASFSPAIQSIPESYVQVLTAAGVDFTIMGSEEWCCGFPLLVAGMRSQAESVRRHNVEKIQEIGARMITFTCPSCYNTFVNEYAPHLPGVEMLHSTQLLQRLIDQGKLKLGSLTEKVTYHDPCDLARNSGVYDPPRRVLRSIPGVELVEPADSREHGHCCGGGGDLEIANPELAGSIAVSSLLAFEDTGAGTLVTACQQCKRMFQNAIQQKGSQMKILDVGELVHRALAQNGSEER